MASSTPVQDTSHEPTKKKKKDGSSKSRSTSAESNVLAGTDFGAIVAAHAEVRAERKRVSNGIWVITILFPFRSHYDTLMLFGQRLLEKVEQTTNQPAADLASIQVGGTPEFERTIGAAMAVAIKNQESIMLHLEELHHNEDMRLNRESVLEQVLSKIQSNVKRRERSVSVSIP